MHREARPPATDWLGKAYYVLNGRMIVRVDEAFDLGPGSVITIPPGALHTETVLSPTVKYLAVGLTRAMGRFFADLDAAVPHGRPIAEVTQQIQEVLARHDVTLAGFQTSSPEPVSSRWIFALLAAAIHIVVFIRAAILIERPSVHEGVFGLPYVPAVQVWAFGVGFYNLFLRVRHGRRRDRVDERQRNGRKNAGDLHQRVHGSGSCSSSPTGWDLAAREARALGAPLARVCAGRPHRRTGGELTCGCELHRIFTASRPESDGQHGHGQY